jgi:hypothetical protein
MPFRVQPNCDLVAECKAIITTSVIKICVVYDDVHGPVWMVRACNLIVTNVLTKHRQTVVYVHPAAASVRAPSGGGPVLQR